MRVINVSHVYIGTQVCSSSRFGILNALNKSGHETILVSPTVSLENGYRKTYGVDTYLVKLPGVPYINIALYQILIFFELITLLKTFRPNMVLIDLYSFWGALPLIILSKIKKNSVHFILDFRSGVFHKRNTKIKNFMLSIFIKISISVSQRFVSAFTFITSQLKDHIISSYKLSINKSAIWTSAVSDILLSVYPENYSNSNNEIKVIYHGTLEQDRGLFELVEAISNMPNISLTIIGDGSIKNSLYETIKEKNISNVCIYGSVPQEEIAHYILNSDVGVCALSDTLPMKTSSPLKVLEYISFNKPVICTNHGGMVDNLIQVFHGIITIDDNKPADIKNGLLMYMNNKDKYDRKAMSGRSTILSHYTWDNQAAKLGNLFMEISE